jgi:hypothetical protein
MIRTGLWRTVASLLFALTMLAAATPNAARSGGSVHSLVGIHRPSTAPVNGTLGMVNE